jgi:uncharacterized membrane protein YcaP (DUF421 family)
LRCVLFLLLFSNTHSQSLKQLPAFDCLVISLFAVILSLRSCTKNVRLFDYVVHFLLASIGSVTSDATAAKQVYQTKKTIKRDYTYLWIVSRE